MCLEISHQPWTDLLVMTWHGPVNPNTSKDKVDKVVAAAAQWLARLSAGSVTKGSDHLKTETFLTLIRAPRAAQPKHEHRTFLATSILTTSPIECQLVSKYSANTIYPIHIMAWKYGPLLLQKESVLRWLSTDHNKCESVLLLVFTIFHSSVTTRSHRNRHYSLTTKARSCRNQHITFSCNEVKINWRWIKTNPMFFKYIIIFNSTERYNNVINIVYCGNKQNSSIKPLKHLA